MQFLIHFTYPNGTEDSLGIEGETIEDIRALSLEAMESRGLNWDNCNFWSEEK